jgi:hypothetical protein
MTSISAHNMAMKRKTSFNPFSSHRNSKDAAYDTILNDLTLSLKTTASSYDLEDNKSTQNLLSTGRVGKFNIINLISNQNLTTEEKNEIINALDNLIIKSSSGSSLDTNKKDSPSSNITTNKTISSSKIEPIMSSIYKEKLSASDLREIISFLCLADIQRCNSNISTDSDNSNVKSLNESRSIIDFDNNHRQSEADLVQNYLNNRVVITQRAFCIITSIPEYTFVFKVTFIYN